MGKTHTNKPGEDRRHHRRVDARSRHWLKPERDARPLSPPSEKEAVERAAAIARVTRGAQPVTIVFAVPGDTAPALRSAVQELSDTIAYRLETTKDFRQEDAFTCAMRAIAALRTAIFAAVPRGDERYAVR